MLDRPIFATEGVIKEKALEAAFDIFEGTTVSAKDEKDLTEGVLFNEHVAISVLGLMGFNIVMQRRGTKEEYLEWVKKAILEAYDKIKNDPDIGAFTPGGVEVSDPAEYIEAAKKKAREEAN